MNKEDVRFDIDQLRKDKIIYGIEAIATDLAALLVIFLTGWLSPNYAISTTVIVGAIVIGVGYTLFMGITNFKRLQKIERLEKKLKD